MSKKPPIRILLAKIGLDGHDRGVKVLARSFREAGFEVIYTGLWQTAESTMYAAMQEDVDIIGVSLLSAAHMTVVPELTKHRNRLGVESTPILLGGIIPVEDHPTVKEMGVAAIFNPGSAMSDIIESIKSLVGNASDPPLDALKKGFAAADPAALAKIITRMAGPDALNGWTPPEGNATIIGVTGAPGVGKSSFIGKLGAELRIRNLKVAVIAVDPSSPISGGALLGDRLRMMTSKPDESFFVRSIASSDVHGGLGPHCAEIARLLSGFGFDVVFLETVGAGQSDVAIRNVVDHTMLLLMPESGDAIQFSKAGIMEIATHFVLNKCDLDGADKSQAQLLSAVGDDRPIHRVSSVNSEGIPQIADWIASLR
jgi:LAO/AO transport system ATPase